MTSRERLICAMRGGEPDRVPVAPFGLGRIDPRSETAEELIRKTDILIDAGGGGNVFLGSGAAVEIEHSVAVTTHTYKTPLGPLTKRIHRTEVTSATVEFPLKSPLDVEKFLSIPYEEPPLDLSRYFEWEARLQNDGLALVGVPNAVCLAAEWFSPEMFCLCWADRPDIMLKLTSIAAERLNPFVSRMCEAGARAFRIIGGEYVTVQLGPAAVDQLLTPFDTELVRIIHGSGGIAYYHNHGPVMRFVRQLAALEIDALDPLEAPPWGDADLEALRRLVGERLCFVGNLDDMEVIDSLPEEEVLALAKTRLRHAGKSAFILGGTASGTYGERGASNFIAMAEMVDAL